MEVKYSQITSRLQSREGSQRYSNNPWSVGDIATSPDGRQFVITDAEQGIATLRELQDERYKPEFIQADVLL